MTKRAGPSLWTEIAARTPSVRGLLPLAFGLMAWQAIQSGVTNSPYFPPPSAWWRGLNQIAANGRLWSASLATIETILVGLLLSVLLGATLGVLLGSSRFARRALGPLLEFCRAMPPPAIVPLAILFLGYDERMKLTIVAISAMWPILLNTAAAVEDIHPILIDVASSFRLTTWQRIRHVIFPSTVPAILLGLRVALPLTIVLTILVEILTSIDGVGALMIAAQRNFQSAQVYGLLAYVGLFGFVLNNALALIEATILGRWPPQSLHA
jgi:ABC-type nitrate/sulfonate/bicarbonate transport system permease component